MPEYIKSTTSLKRGQDQNANADMQMRMKLPLKHDICYAQHLER